MHVHKKWAPNRSLKQHILLKACRPLSLEVSGGELQTEQAVFLSLSSMDFDLDLVFATSTAASLLVSSSAFIFIISVRSPLLFCPFAILLSGFYLVCNPFCLYFSPSSFLLESFPQKQQQQQQKTTSVMPEVLN